MNDRLRFFWNRMGERLWVRPLIMCALAIVAVFTAKGADATELGRFVPEITVASIETLLTVISASMLVIATFSVSSMVAAYASAGSTATPRSFSLVLADDVSQNALSVFIGAFIYSIVALIAVENSFYDKAGRFTLFVLTLSVFAIVILMFVVWVDSVARLGRLGTTIDKVEAATAKALRRRRSAPTLGGVPVKPRPAGARPVYATRIGYIERVDLDALQRRAEDAPARIEVAAMPGDFVAPGRPLAYVTSDAGVPNEINDQQVARAFSIGDNRTFDEDPCFGLIALSEIASRALSPGINDPGTAIDVIGTLVRLFVLWSEPLEANNEPTISYDRVAVPELQMPDMFDAAFAAIARDGAGAIEVVVWLQSALASLASTGNTTMGDVAREQARQALARAERTLDFPDDLRRARESAQFAQEGVGHASRNPGMQEGEDTAVTPSSATSS